jgi:hypothetical protein
MDLPDREVNDLEARLARWQPASITPDRDRTMFLAGRAAARSDARFRVATGSAIGLVLMVATLGMMLNREHGRRKAAEVALAEASRPASTPLSPFPEPDPRPPSADSYFVLSLHPADLDTPREVASLRPSAEEDRPASTPLRVGDRSRLPEL